MNEHDSIHEQNMHKVPEVKTARTVPKRLSRSGRTDDMVQGLPLRLFKRVGQVGSRECEEARGRQAIQGKQAWIGKASGVQENRCDEAGPQGMVGIRGGQKIQKTIHAVREKESGSSSLLREREGQEGNRTIPKDCKGTGKPSKRRSQETIEDKADGLRLDSGTVGGNQGIAREQVCDVRATEAVDERPYHSAEQRRAAYSVEHSGAMPKLQQQEKQSATANYRTMPVQQLAKARIMQPLKVKKGK
jgi:hypothetical protein